MMQLKKIFISLLVVVIALTTLTVAASAADAGSVDFAVSISGTADADGTVVYNPGDTVDVVIDVHNNPGIALLEVYLKYDSAILAPVDKNNDGKFDKNDCVAGSFLDSDTYVFEAEDGRLTFKTSLTAAPTPIVDAEGNVIKDGEIVKLSFKVLANAHDDEAAIYFESAKAVAVAGGKMASVKVNTTNAKYAVHDLEIVKGVPATCFVPGCTDGATCKSCDYGVASVAIPALNHPTENRVVIPAVPGSCTAPAVSAGEQCGLCYTVLVAPQVGDSVAHVPSGTWEVVTPATHTATGKQQQKCKNCDAIALVEVIPQIVKHNWVVDKTVAPTCLDAGYTTYTCECGDSKVETFVNALGHDWDNGVENKAPTCTTVGETTYTCSTCKETKTVNVPAKGHDININVVAPTCTEKGYNEHICKVCGDYKVDTYVDAKGHTYTSSVVVAATCTDSGETLYTCVCGDKYTENVAPKGHTYSSVATAPTCTAMGYTTYTCACGDKYVADYVDAKGHTYASAVTAPTCTAMGYTTYTCACGDKYVADYVDAKGHTYTSAVTAPTCTAMGYTTYTCTCGDKYVADYVDAKGHTYTSAVTAPTCTAMGYTTYTCTCGDKYVADYVDAKGHTVESIPAVEPTISEFGSTEGEKCTVCDTVTVEPAQLPKKCSAWIWITVIGGIIVVGSGVSVLVVGLNKKKKAK